MAEETGLLSEKLSDLVPEPPAPAAPQPPTPPHGNGNRSPGGRFRRKVVSITAVEDDGDHVGVGGVGVPNLLLPAAALPVGGHGGGADDVIPGPPPTNQQQQQTKRETSQSRSRGSFLSRVVRTGSGGAGGGGSASANPNGSGNPIHRQNKSAGHLPGISTITGINAGNSGNGVDELQLSRTEHLQWSGAGILANRADLELPPEQFAAGCNLLQAAARGDWGTMEALLDSGKTDVNFRDYDRRTALHVAVSEGQLAVCRSLVRRGARVNRSDRWGGSPLDDAHRHRHSDLVTYLRSQGASTGSGNRATNLIKAAADGDVDEVQMLLNLSVHDGKTAQQAAAAAGGIANGGGGKRTLAADLSHKKKVLFDVNQTDYDKRSALHLAAGEGHVEIVRVLCQAGANANAEDRWHRRPLDDAIDSKHEECADVLREYGAVRVVRKSMSSVDDSSTRSKSRLDDNLRVDFGELEMIDRIGAGAFGEIYKCRWRGTLVAAKIIKSAKIRRDWVNKRMLDAIEEGKDVDEAVQEMDAAEMEEDEKDLAIADFQQEIAVLRTLRHPHIVLLLAYSTTENYECLISELMKCSLLDVFRSHMVQGTKMKHKTQIIYATQLSRGMAYLHSCRPPVVHRDLKPANLLIDPSGVLKIADFGLSKIRPTPGQTETDTFTMTGETGSYRFMAPEVFRHEEYNETVDVYSYAMILFYLLAGRPPWPTLPGLEAVKRAADQGDRPNIPRDLDARLQNLLKECWDDNPSNRPPFTTITKVLTAYSSDVFKESEDTMVSAPAPSDAKCDCAIL